MMRRCRLFSKSWNAHWCAGHRHRRVPRAISTGRLCHPSPCNAIIALKFGFREVVMQSEREKIEKLRELIKDIDIAMLTTVDEDGSLRSRPMGTQEAEFDGDLWFFTSLTTGTAIEIQLDNRV